MTSTALQGNIQVGTEGIKHNLRKFKVHQAIAEYIWNGFDAGATQIDIEFTTFDETGVIRQLKISDDGSGIKQDELKQKFEPFLESNKKEHSPTARNTGSLIKGKNGVGRLTFFHFSENAIWETVYRSKQGNKKYQINVDASNLKHYVATQESNTKSQTGTTVTFSNIYNLEAGFKLIHDYILKEFSWFIKLHECRNYKITINGEELKFDNIIKLEDSKLLTVGEYEFNTRIVIWKRQLNKEYSKFYYSTDDGSLKLRETTSFNNKGDGFHHSIFISSSYFNNFVYEKKKENKELDELFTNHSPTFLDLKGQLNTLIADKRREFIAERTNILVDSYEQEGVFPKVNTSNKLDSIRHDQLRNIVGGLYQVEPALFNSLSIPQKKTLVRLLDVVQVGQGVDDLFEIIKEVIDLNEKQKKELAELLKVTTMSSIIKTIKVIKDRYHAIEVLEQLVFNENRKANEVDHVQKFIEQHYWIFGEQYNLVTAAEPSFVEGLKRFRYILDGFKNPPKEAEIDHEHMYKEPDIFMIRQDFVEGKRKCILVELKHPKKPLGDKEFSQVKKYLKVVTATDQFNGDDIIWEFHLVGNRFTRDNDEIPNAIESTKQYGKKNLAVVSHAHNYEVYVQKWSDIKVELEHRLRFLQEQLELQRESLVPPANEDADELVENSQNSASRPKEMEFAEKTN